jgi:outer membrane protein TolC
MTAVDCIPETRPNSLESTRVSIRPKDVHMTDSNPATSIPRHLTSHQIRHMVFNVLLAAALSAASGPPEEWFLRQVLLRNPSMLAESLSLAGSRETRVGANSLLLPQFNLSADASASSNFDDTKGYSGEGIGQVAQILPTAATVQGTILGGRTSSEHPVLGTSSRDTVGAGISITQPFLRGFGDGSATFYSVNQARSADVIQLQASRSTVLAILSQARTAWWRQKALQSMMAAHIQDTARTSRLLLNARQNLHTGAGSLLDTIQAFADYLQSRSELLAASTAARSGAVDLGAYLDSSEVWIGDTATDTLAIAPPDELPAQWPSVDSLMHLAEAGAPDIAGALAQVEKARSEKIFRDREALPTLTAGVFARKAFVPTDATPKGVVGGVQANFSWDIPNGVNSAAARKALLDLHKAGVLAAKSRQDLRRSLVKFLGLSRQYAEALVLQRQLIQAKQAQLTAAEQGFRDGAVSWTDLTSIRRDWLNAVAAAWSAVASAQETESDIQSLTGTGPARLGWNWGE